MMTDRTPIKSHAAFSIHYESSSESSSDGFRLNSASSSETIRPSTAGSSTETLKPENEESSMTPSRQEILLSGSDWSQDRHSDFSTGTSGWSSIDGDYDCDRKAALTVTKCLVTIDKLLFGEEINNEEQQFVSEEVKEECKLWRENFTYLRLSGNRICPSRSTDGLEYFPRSGAAVEDDPDEEIDLPPVEIQPTKSAEFDQSSFQKPDMSLNLEGKRMIPKVPAANATYAEEVIESHGIVEELIASDRNQIAVKVKKRPKSSSGKIEYYPIKYPDPLTPEGVPNTRVIYERPNPPARAATVLSNAPSTSRPFQSTRNASRASGDYRGQFKQNQEKEIQLQEMMQKGISSLKVKGSSHSLDSRLNINREATDVFPSLKMKESFLNRPATTQSRQREGSRNQSRPNNRVPLKKHRLEPLAPKSRLQSRQNYDSRGLDQLMGHSISQKELSKSYSSIESRVSPTNNTSSSRLFSRPSDTLVRIPESRPDTLNDYPIKHSVSSRLYDHSSERANFSQASRRQPLTIANQVSKMNIIQGIEGKPPPKQKYHYHHRHHHM
ncbi:Oidioi.mRNA.OKI2018_I69.chr1.g129.t1.cds [Oikopleura dioica]|uniref:Oidioi.mRNA.OKI2018_I69.chr1.g129.t1.cds n=1 Tax=Oikopleura dioica TaxID=34765 RepID=A0ABN7SP02_OIKDI|nr:Oidioi.mRNA.OKI2018_I69.chr1.g129.t1.cds [Oikopleura dioica]